MIQNSEILLGKLKANHNSDKNKLISNINNLITEK